MPFTNGPRSNNRVLPANSRAVDVAKQMLERVVPVQQLRYANALEVNGYETMVYSRLKHGTVCSCQSRRGAAATLLDENGKLKPGHMDTLLSGGLSFRVQPYGTKDPQRSDLRDIRGAEQQKEGDDVFLDDDGGNQLADFDIEDDLENPHTTVTHAPNEDEEDAQDIIDHSELDDNTTGFDAEQYTNDTKCAICFGSGYVGGFSLLNGLRLVLTTQWDQTALRLVNGTIETNRTPYSFMSQEVQFTVVFPKGVAGVDTFRVWNNDMQTHPSAILIDNLPYSMDLLRAFCDGRAHTLTVKHDKLTYWTHVELQFNLSDKIERFELPRKTDGSNMSMVDPAEDMALNASPTIPDLQREDVLVECTLGKALIVNSVTDWKTSKRNILGWDVNARVIQPAELLNLLPRRRSTHQQTTWMVRDNADGRRRT